jgi:hypothetical protein
VHGIGAPLVLRVRGVEHHQREALAVVGDEHLLLHEAVDLLGARTQLGREREVLVRHVVAQAGTEHGDHLGHAHERRARSVDRACDFGCGRGAPVVRRRL